MKNEDKTIFYYFGLLGQIGLTVILSVMFFVMVYKFLIEKYISDNPIFFILFIITGIAGGFMSVWKIIMKEIK